MLLEGCDGAGTKSQSMPHVGTKYFRKTCGSVQSTLGKEVWVLYVPQREHHAHSRQKKGVEGRGRGGRKQLPYVWKDLPGSNG